ncbi:MAG TPA: hypothetical protein VK364_01105 [Hymenobacter sp.]|nr:hypothetical protein [Hymenobacter sp.]
MAFTGQEHHDVTLNDAAAMTKRYRDASINPIKGGFFGRDAIEAILAQTDCVGMRFYFALDDAQEPKMTVVLVGTKANEDDIVSGRIMDTAIPCPNRCGANNKLNS